MTDPVFHFQQNDAMRDATRRAQKTFRYFWRELSWEARRIIPGLGLSAVKIPVRTDSGGTAPEFEHMWFSDVSFDGKHIGGTLLNQPSWVSTMKQGSAHRVGLDGISDWLYAINDRAYGGFSVAAMRQAMGAAERRKHDTAWGLDFGDPATVLIVPREKVKKGFFSRPESPGYTDGEAIPEHPMSLNMKPGMAAEIRKNPDLFLKPGDDGATMLHFDALAGNLAQVEVLLQCGADRTLKDRNGMTPRDRAAVLRWDAVMRMLS
jgi:uncharacterized protein YegJ (DUF2314 family)